MGEEKEDKNNGWRTISQPFFLCFKYENDITTSFSLKTRATEGTGKAAETDRHLLSSTSTHAWGTGTTMVGRIVLRILAFLALHLLAKTANSFSLVHHRRLFHHGPSSSPSSAGIALRAAKRASVVVAEDGEDEDEGGGEGCRVLLLDHLNINHERGRHDALKSFYFDFLGCGIDPRKYDNYLAGEKVSESARE